LGDWQLSFPVGNYVATVAGGNFVGGPGGDPIAYSAGVQTLIIQSAASTVVTAGGSVPSAAQVAAAVLAAAEAAPIAANLEKVNAIPIVGSGVAGDSFRPAS
jgi:hypothetical protein